MTSLARRERSQLGQLTLTANAQGHRLRAAERPARSGAAPTESKTAASTGRIIVPWRRVVHQKSGRGGRAVTP